MRILKIIGLFLVLLNGLDGFSQTPYHVRILDQETKAPIVGAKVIFKKLRLGSISDSLGYVNIPAVPDSTHTLMFSAIGYELKELTLDFPRPKDASREVFLVSRELDVIIVEATRSDRSIADLPTRTEVLTEEIDEAASMEPSKISHLITHSTGIQVQTTSASSNGAVVRIQGLNGRYTQILKDGFPLYGGFSGSLDILQIPPLDLRQVEYIKGSASTLYGGGAIGGLINLLSKKPESDELLLHVNLSHIGAKDFNFFSSRRFGKFGFTNLSSFHTHSPYDPDKDGFSDIPSVLKMNFNPRLFYYPNEKSTIYLGVMFTKENRMGGDMTLIQNGEISPSNFYFDYQETERITTQFSAGTELKKGALINVKNSFSSYERYIHIREDVFGNESKFAGRQSNSFTEFNIKKRTVKHDLVGGLNIYTSDFQEKVLDTSVLRNQQFFTYGLFVNHLFNVRPKFIIESGLRLDYALAQGKTSASPGEAFILPKFSALWKVAKPFSIRLGGGLGYRMPSVFSEEAEPLGYKNVNPIDFSFVKAERSYGGNIDFKVNTTFGTKNILFTFNQMFFYNIIDNPILLNIDSTGGFNYENSNGLLNSRGFESQIKLTFWQFTWFFGYTFTEAFIEDAGLRTNLVLTPKHSIKGDLLFVVDDKWRIGWDYEFKSEQLLSNGLYSPTLFTTGVIVERTLGNFVIFLNAENFTDVRQSKYASTLSGPNNTPQFTDIWAPLDGFFFNAGLKIKL